MVERRRRLRQGVAVMGVLLRLSLKGGKDSYTARADGTQQKRRRERKEEERAEKEGSGAEKEGKRRR